MKKRIVSFGIPGQATLVAAALLVFGLMFTGCPTEADDEPETPPPPLGAGEKIIAGGSSVPAYRFTPPAGSTWGDYKTITFTVAVGTQANYELPKTRGFVVGNYTPARFYTEGRVWNGDWGGDRFLKFPGDPSAADGFGGDGVDTTTFKTMLGNPGLKRWKVLSYPIVRSDIDGTVYKNDGYLGGNTQAAYPAGTDAGPFYLGLGFCLNANTIADGDTITYYLKDVALVKADGTKLPPDDFGTIFAIRGPNTMDPDTGSFTIPGDETTTTLGNLWVKGHESRGSLVRSWLTDIDADLAQ
ncbi:hypothetical protein AGMMS50267_16050 [Spirochaetia bacterium]|nr:hypothetical protein AGMMS50267_16050 [Spirochaetia bacterium]